MLDDPKRIQEIKEEIDFADYKKIMPKVAMFRHLEIVEQDKFIEQMFEFPKLQAYLLEIQMLAEGKRHPSKSVEKVIDN